MSGTPQGLSQQLTLFACRAQDTLFAAPCLMRHTIDAQASKGFSNITAVYATPTTPGRCRAIIRNLFKFKSPVPTFFFSKQCCHTAEGKAAMRVHSVQTHFRWALSYLHQFCRANIIICAVVFWRIMFLPDALELSIPTYRCRGAYVYHQHPVTCNTKIKHCRHAYV